MIRVPHLVLLALLAAASAAPAAELAVLSSGFSIRHSRHENLGAVTRLYLGPGAESGFLDVPTAQIARFEREEIEPPPPQPDPAASTTAPAIPDLIAAAARRHQVDADLLHSIIRAESDYNPRAVSPKGAQGLMQLMPQTAAALGVADAFDPAANIEAGTRYLRQLLDFYNRDLVLALAAYNAGPERVAQFGGVPPYSETRHYVARVIRDFNRTKLAARQAASAPAPRQTLSSPAPRIAAAQPPPSLSAP